MGDPSPGILPPVNRPRSSGFVEGNRVLPSSRCEDRPAVGKARGHARSPPLHDRMGSVYAFSSELDVWMQTRRPGLEEEGKTKIGRSRGG